MRVDVSDAAWAQGSVDSQNWQPAKGRNMVYFYDREIKNNARTIAEGRPCFDSVCHLKIIIPGDKTLEIDRKASQQDKMKYEREWESYLKKQAAPVVGTPLEAWPVIDRSQVAELKAMNIFTVDQLAGLSDSLGVKIMGFQGWKQKAQHFLDAAKDSSMMEKQHEELAKRDAQIAELQAQMVKLIENQATLIANQKKRPGRKPKPKPYAADPPATD